MTNLTHGGEKNLRLAEVGQDVEQNVGQEVEPDVGLEKQRMEGKRGV